MSAVTLQTSPARTDAPATTAATIPLLVSMLHQKARGHSAELEFLGQPVLCWTLRRAAMAGGVGRIVVACWDDQLAAACEATARSGVARAEVRSAGPRAGDATLRRVAAARRWADGWRGGPGGTCYFDLGFSAEVAAKVIGDGTALLLLPAESGLVDPAIVADIVARHSDMPELDVVFSQAPGGLAPASISTGLVVRLAKTRGCPGRLLSYQPDAPMHDPISGKGCVGVATKVARSLGRFDLGSARQIGRMTAMVGGMDVAVMDMVGIDAEMLAGLAAAKAPGEGELPAEVTVELTTRRATRPIFGAGSYLSFSRADMDPAVARRVFSQLAGGSRVLLGGMGDPLLYGWFADIVRAAAEAGVESVAVETDLVEMSDDALVALTSGTVDVVAVHMPAATGHTYARMMGVDGLGAVLENLKRLCAIALPAGVPVVVPVFTKTAANLEEMEAVYDHFLRALGAAAIDGPSTRAGQLPEVGVVDMSPPQRGACRRLGRRMTIWSDGSVPVCDNDVRGLHLLGNAAVDAIGELWTRGLRPVREAHERLTALPVLCQSCADWDRP
jgi:hypothetical protein